MKTEELQTYCIGFKGSTQELKGGVDLCYCVGGKIFCVIDTDHSNSVAFKTRPEKYISWIDREGIVPAPYTARYHWVLVENASALKKNEWIEYI